MATEGFFNGLLALCAVLALVGFFVARLGTFYCAGRITLRGVDRRSLVVDTLGPAVLAAGKDEGEGAHDRDRDCGSSEHKGL